MENKEVDVTQESVVGFGELISKARQDAGMSIVELSMSTNIMQDKLKALEEERLEDLPEPVYVRAFIRSVAKVLELDPNPIIEKYTARLGGAHDIIHQIPVGNPTEEAPLRDSHSEYKLKAVFASALMLLVGASIWAVYTDKFEGLHSQSEAQKIEMQASEIKPDAIKSEELNLTETKSVDESTKAEEKSLNNSDANKAVLPVVQKKDNVLGDSDLHKVVVTVSLPCWVQVTTPDGKRLLAKEMKKNESQTLSVPKGARFTIGNTNAASVVVDGSQYDFSNSIRNGIARFILQ